MQGKYRAWILPAAVTGAAILAGFFLTTLWSEFIEYDRGPTAPPSDPAFDPTREPDFLFPRESQEPLTAAGGWVFAGTAFGAAWWTRQQGKDRASEALLLLGGAFLSPLPLLVDVASVATTAAILVTAAYCLWWDTSVWTRAGMASLVGLTVVFLVQEIQSGTAWTAFLLVAGLLAYPVAWALRVRRTPHGWVPLAIGGAFSAVVLFVAVADVVRFGGVAEWGMLAFAAALGGVLIVTAIRLRPDDRARSDQGRAPPY